MTLAAQATHADDIGAGSPGKSNWVKHVLGGGIGGFSRQDKVWQPAVNVYEDAGAYRVVADLGGMPAKDVDLHIADGVLVLRGVRQTPGAGQGSQKTHVHVMEIDHGPFHREIEMPGNVNVEAIEATYRFGFLWITIPKQT